jgi:hypothetical protein
MQVPRSQPLMAGLEEEPSDSATEECSMSLLWAELAPGLQLGCGNPRFAPLEPTSEESDRRDDDCLQYDAGLGSCASDEEAGWCQWVAPASPPELTEGLFSFVDNVRFFTQRVWSSFHACPLLRNVGPAADSVHVLQVGLPDTVQNNTFREISVVTLFSVKNGQYFGPQKFFLRLPAQYRAAAKAAAHSTKRVRGKSTAVICQQVPVSSPSFSRCGRLVSSSYSFTWQYGSRKGCRLGCCRLFAK